MWALDVWAVLTSRVQIRRYRRRRPKQRQQGVRPPGEDYVGARMRLAGLRARGTSTSCRVNRAARGSHGWYSQRKAGGFAQEGGRAAGHWEDKEEEA